MRFAIFSKKSVFATIAVSLGIVILLVAVIFSESYVVFAGKTTRELPIYCVDRQDKVVALSFDASWGADKTPAILDVLEKYDAVANFFCVGFWAEKYPEQLKAISDSGRMEIGTHSDTHSKMSLLSAARIEQELSSSCAKIEAVTKKKIDLFRAPYGDYDDELIRTARDNGYYTIQWDVDTLDWKGYSAAQIANRVLGKVKCGSIVLMHNDGEHTVEALPAIIEGLRNKGYTLVTIGEMIYRDNYTIDHTGKQIRNEG